MEFFYDLKVQATKLNDLSSLVEILNFHYYFRESAFEIRNDANHSINAINDLM